MRYPVLLAALACLGISLLSRGAVRGAAPAPIVLPPLTAAYPLPALPERSSRSANYTIEARLDPAKHVIEGRLVLDWRNTSGVSLSSFPFHLYWNAFRNSLSTSARGEGRRAARSTSAVERERGYGYTSVRAVRLLGEREADLTSTLRFVQPDDDNKDDRTVVEVTTPAPVAPGATARFQIDWISRVPYGDVGRAGWIHDYHFIAQWFPKIGVHWKGAWNCHQFHATTEFFADYGSYDVRLTLPQAYVVGATGLLAEGPTPNADGTQTLGFHQDDVHDFAWAASRRFLERRARFDDPGYPPVDIRLLLQPEHAHLAERYLESARIALRSYGTWSAPYPYPQVTVVDPAWSSASGGMEYPTLFTGGVGVWSPQTLHSPESVTTHEMGHQFWYGLVGNNEFEEAWLDEGFNEYHEAKTRWLLLGPEGWGRYYFGLADRRRSGWPVVAPGVWVGRGDPYIVQLRKSGQTDAMVQRGWEYGDPDSYTLNSYGKPALTLQTLESLVGDDTMTRILRTYARRYRFGHPTTQDFIDTVTEVTGKDYRWFFEETWFSSELCDYAVSVENEPGRTLEGYADGPGGVPVLAPRPAADERKAGEPYDSEVVVRRLGEVRMPVEILVQFADGRRLLESWDGEYRWKRFKYHGAAKVVRAAVDPDRKLAIDVNPSNNIWVDEDGQSRRAALKWSARWMFWLQNLLELHAVLG